MNQETLSASDLFRLLDEHQVEFVSVEFAGSGDSGDVEDVQFSPAPPTDPAIENALVDLSYDLISQNFSGYEINEGGKGSIEFEKDKELGEWSVSGSCLYAEEIKEESGADYSLERVQASLSAALEGQEGEPSLMARLAERGVREIEVTYFGYGDSRDIAGLGCYGEDREHGDNDPTIDIHDIDSDLLEHLNAMIDAHDPGFEQEYGGGGTLNLHIDDQGRLEDVEADAYLIEVRYNEDYTSPFSYTQEGLIAAREEDRRQSLDDRMSPGSRSDFGIEP